MNKQTAEIRYEALTRDLNQIMKSKHNSVAWKRETVAKLRAEINECLAVILN